MSYSGSALGGVLPLGRNVIGVFYSPSQQGFTPYKFFTSVETCGFSLYSKEQVSLLCRFFLIICAVLNRPVVRTIWILLWISYFSILFSRFFGIVQSTPNMISITVKLIFHQLLLLFPNYAVVWNEPLQALDFMLMHTKLNLCALIRKATSPH